MTRLLRRDQDSQADDTTPAWFEAAYQQFAAQILDDPTFPCYFVAAANARETLRYSYISSDELDTPVVFASALSQYLLEYRPWERVRH